ncbi:copper amine oxidase N-terminal domain-containing protein [Paenibacillus methanolicus]|uniref:copper amine oxidase N-terminal domain-containing protein n=1 Tax=Paenibacillus methanolicus TaxID=582686 RepID=UPI0011E65BE2|nr:copper amine oxidase N-terminal domain-containing protein [Paenibacillus methanolicus]
MRKKAKFLLLCLSFMSIFWSTQQIPSINAANSDEFTAKVVLNGKQMNFDPNVIAWNSTTLVPFRQLFEAYSAEVQWDSVTKTVTAKKDDTTIKITMDNFQAWVNDKEYRLTQTPFIAEGTAYVNLRFVSEALGATVSYNKKDNVVLIDWVDDEQK